MWSLAMQQATSLYISIQPTYPAHDEVITVSLLHPSPKYLSFPDTNPQWKNPKLSSHSVPYSSYTSYRPMQTPRENTAMQVLPAATPERILQTLNALTAMLRYCCTLTSLTTQTSNLVVLLGFLFRPVFFSFFSLSLLCKQAAINLELRIIWLKNKNK